MQLFASVQPSHLTVQYQHAHQGPKTIYLYNHLFDWFGILSGDVAKGALHNNSLPPTSALAAVFAHGNGAVLLEQGMPAPTPPGISAFAPRIPLCQRLRPGETATVTIRLPLPLEEWHPNVPPKPERSWPMQVHSLTMKVVYVEENRPGDASEHPTYRGLYQVSGYPLHELRATVTLDAPITLRVRQDPIYRAT